MASKLGILLIAFLSIIILPLLSSAFFFHHLPAIQHHRHRHHHHRRHHHLFRPLIFRDGIKEKLKDDVEDEDNGKTGLFKRMFEKDDEAQPKEEVEKEPEEKEEPLADEEEPIHEGADYNEEPRKKKKKEKDEELENVEDYNEEPRKKKEKNEEGGDVQNEDYNEEPKKKGDPQPKEGGKGGLREAFYEETCPQAEKIVNQTIQKHFKKDPTLAAAFVRLFSHDCLVTGCDASIMLDNTPTGEEVEKKATHNGRLVRGFETIDDIKEQLEAECPGVVSCADLLAFANRESLVFTGLPNYEVAAGRRDGLASLAKNVDGNLPTSNIPAEQAIQMFQKKGLTLEDLVVLIGAHSIGSAHCEVVSPRFHDQNLAKEVDPGYLFKMQTMSMCQSEDQVLAFDPYSQNLMDSRYYKELLTNKALLEADHLLAKEPRTRNIMNKLVDDQKGWLAKFTVAIKKLGEVEVLTGDQGEIRKKCRVVNGNE